jgi:hypothetical protein
MPIVVCTECGAEVPYEYEVIRAFAGSPRPDPGSSFDVVYLTCPEGHVHRYELMK